MKYKNKHTTIDGHKFASKKEAHYYIYLKEMQEQGKIKNLELQPKFSILDSVQYKGRKLKERFYIADFAYFKDGNIHIIDVKSPATEKDKTYRIKRQMFLLAYPELIFEEVI